MGRPTVVELVAQTGGNAVVVLLAARRVPVAQAHTPRRPGASRGWGTLTPSRGPARSDRLARGYGIHTSGNLLGLVDNL